MIENIISLILITIAIIAEFSLSIMKRKKSKEYHNDERWQLIQLKSKNLLQHEDWIFIILAVILMFFVDDNTMLFTAKQIMTFIIVFFGIQSFIELAGLIFYDKNL